MDVMKPNIVWLNGRCYRLYGQIINGGHDTRGYDDNDGDFVDYDLLGATMSDDEYVVDPTDSGRLQTAFHVPRSLHGVLVGSKGSARQRLEKETKTSIRIPRKGLNEDIVVLGATRENVVQARRRMELMILAARQKQQFTHFISFPMNGNTIKDRFCRFKDHVLAECKGRGVTEDLFQNPDKLHLTLGTLTLLDDVDRKQAASALQACLQEVIEPILGNHKLRLCLCGLDFMNDDPAEVDVLYAKIEDRSEVKVVQELADNLVQNLTKTGLMPKQHDSVKLHVTLMNSKFRHNDSRNESIEADFQKKPRETFDATPILKKFQGFDFGEIIIRSVDLSRRYSTAANGYYEATVSITL